MSRSRSDSEILGEALNETKGFVYVNGAELTLVSVCWFFCSLLVITVGPATLGAYTAVASLRENEGINARRVWTTVRSELVGTTLLSLLPVILAGVSLLYAVRYLTTGTLLAGALALVGAYGVIFSLLVLVPTFVSLAQGMSVPQALRQGYLWTVKNPTLTLAVGLITAIIGCVLLVFVVAFPLLFAGVACSFHTQVVVRYLDRDIEFIEGVNSDPM